MDFDEEFDVVVLGAGAGGMTAALVAAQAGARTLLVEKTAQAGGTTARSGGAVWIPGNHQQAALERTNDAAAAQRYLDALVGDHGNRALSEAFIEHGPQMLRYLEERSDVRFAIARDELDYRQDTPGASLGGRALRPVEFDGGALGTDFERIAPPLPELMVFGKIMVTRAEVARLVDFPTSADAVGLAAGLFARYLRDRTRFSRGTRLVLGNALAARAFQSVRKAGVPIWFEARTGHLVLEDGRVSGLVIACDGVRRRVRAVRGVVLAGGGFPSSAALRRRFLPMPIPAYTPAHEGATGDTLLLAEEIGASIAAGRENAFWFPSSVAKRPDGTTAVFPHIVLDRAKPGLIAVNAAGRRFVDEACSYHEFVRAMYRSNAQTPSIPATLVCDKRFLWKYGLGMVHPHTRRLGPFLEGRYLHRADTLDELAQRIEVAPDGLRETVARFNAFARSGVDEDFHKGENAFDCKHGDAAHEPNPCLGPIVAPPFYAVAVYPTPLATSAGLRANPNGQVLDRAGRPISGLYACGGDMESPMGGEYPGPGAQIGAAMTFGYLAALHAVGRRADIDVTGPRR
jgi:succinate dehydrogenase/fumarate reductase flavoprotein subunit